MKTRASILWRVAWGKEIFDGEPSVFYLVADTMEKAARDATEICQESIGDDNGLVFPDSLKQKHVVILIEENKG